MWQLGQDAGAIAGFLLGTASSAMIQVQKNLDALLDDVVGFDVLQVRNETDAAGVVFEPRIVQAFRLKLVHARVSFLRALTHPSRGRESSRSFI